MTAVETVDLRKAPLARISSRDLRAAGFAEDPA